MKVVHAGVGEVGNTNPGCTDASTNKGSYTPPGSQVHVSICQEQQFRLGGSVIVLTIIGEAKGRGVEDVRTFEIRVAAILCGDIGAEPVVDPIAHTHVENSADIETDFLRHSADL